MINFKEIALNTITGLYWIGILVAVIMGYAYLINLFNLSKTVETIVLFLPLILFAAYNMGALRRLNSKK
tara:strand:+ start:18 stop:224 length:207 start_codon:yes stop_codon:yes gene_type:complete